MGERWDAVRAAFGVRPRTFEEPQRARFSGYSGWRTDQLLSYAESRVGKIDRAKALSIPAVLRGRNMICSISTLPLETIDADNRVQPHRLFQQIDPNVPNVTTLAMTVEDLLFEAVAWWRVTERGADNYPVSAVRYDPTLVSLQPPASYQKAYLPSDLPTEGVIYMEGHPVPFADVIRFDSPNPAFLTSGERAIRRALALDKAADLYATNQRMRGFFTPKEGVDPASDEAIEDMLTDFADARAKRLDGYVPAALDYNQVTDPMPAELQLLGMQQRADLNIANALGIDPEDLGISTTSRTYQNGVDRRKDRVNDVLGPYMSAVTDRLTMPDVTKRGNKARFWLDDYMKADPKTRAEVQSTYEQMGVLDAADIRQAEGLPPKAILQPALRQAVPPTQISAIPDGAR